jgi:hypothetical protein
MDKDALSGSVKGNSVSILIDTGAIDFNYVDSSIVTRCHLRLYSLPECIRVRSVHSVSTLSKYVVVPVNLITDSGHPINVIVPCLVLDVCPQDIILGMPAINQYNLLEAFATSFKARQQELADKQRRFFPHLPQQMMETPPASVQRVSRVSSGQSLISTTLSPLESYPYDRAPVFSGSQLEVISAGQKSHISLGQSPSHTYSVLTRD